MRLIRNKNNNELVLIDDNGDVLLKISWMADEFVWVLNDSKILITRDVDENFYNNLTCLMNNNYEFFISDGLCYKGKDMIQWLSDQYVDLENEEETITINRLIIEKQDNAFVISAYNPFCSQNGIDRSRYVIGFSPAGNGYKTRNVSTGTTFQDDMVLLYSCTMNKVSMAECITRSVK